MKIYRKSTATFVFTANIECGGFLGVLDDVTEDETICRLQRADPFGDLLLAAEGQTTIPKEAFGIGLGDKRSGGRGLHDALEDDEGL